MVRIDFVKIKFIDELIKIVNLFFNVFEFYFMWEYIVKLFFDCDKLLEVGCKDCNGKGCEFIVKVLVISWFEVFCLMDFILDVVILVS